MACRNSANQLIVIAFGACVTCLPCPLHSKKSGLTEKWGENVRPTDLSDSLYYYYKKSLGLVIARVEDRIGIAALPKWHNADIGCPAGTSVGFVERRSMAADGGVVEYSRTWFNPERVRYVARMK